MDPLIESEDDGENQGQPLHFRPPGVLNDRPWMYIQRGPDGSRMRYLYCDYHDLGRFHRLSTEDGALLCRNHCTQDSECERVVEMFFVNVGHLIGFQGRDARALVRRVIEAVEEGIIDQNGKRLGQW